MTRSEYLIANAIAQAAQAASTAYSANNREKEMGEKQLLNIAQELKRLATPSDLENLQCLLSYIK